MKQSPYLRMVSLGLGGVVCTAAEITVAACTQRRRVRARSVGCGSLSVATRAERQWRCASGVASCACGGGSGVCVCVALGFMFRVEENTVSDGEHWLPSLAARPRGRRRARPACVRERFCIGKACRHARPTEAFALGLSRCPSSLSLQP